jgi:hypothetical protein
LHRHDPGAAAPPERRLPQFNTNRPSAQGWKHVLGWKRTKKLFPLASGERGKLVPGGANVKKFASFCQKRRLSSCRYSLAGTRRITRPKPARVRRRFKSLEHARVEDNAARAPGLA